MSIVVVGSVALDSVETPSGAVRNVLGGSASYFSLAARQHADVKLVGVVGQDFPAEHTATLRDRGIDLEGLSVEAGETFRWSGCYGANLNDCQTLETCLNVFASFQPSLPDSYRGAGVVFLANIDPDLQLQVLEQVEKPWLTAMDTMNLWLDIKRKQVTEVMRRVDVVFLNEGELRQYTGAANVYAAARQVLALGPKALVVKKGEYGAALFADGSYFVTPAYPVETVSDPTGAGDSFAGGFLGHLASQGDLTADGLKRALVHGSVIASFAVEDFSVRRLLSLRPDEVQKRYREFRDFTYFGE